jgi:hypothetical protein
MLSLARCSGNPVYKPRTPWSLRICLIASVVPIRECFFAMAVATSAPDPDRGLLAMSAEVCTAFLASSNGPGQIVRSVMHRN